MFLGNSLTPRMFDVSDPLCVKGLGTTEIGISIKNIVDYFSKDDKWGKFSPENVMISQESLSKLGSLMYINEADGSGQHQISNRLLGHLIACGSLKQGK